MIRRRWCTKIRQACHLLPSSRARESRALNDAFGTSTLFYFCLVALLASVLVPGVSAQSESTSRSLLRGIRVYPGSFWSSTMGLGVGLGYKIEGITGGTSSLRLVTKPQFHRGIYELAYFTADPYEGRSYVGAAIYHELTGRTRYYGVGPFTDSESRVFVEDRLVRVRVTTGIPLDGGRWLIQPVAEYWNAEMDSFRNDDAEAFELMSEASQSALTRFHAHEGRADHLAAGIELGRYFGPNMRSPSSSVQVTAERIQSLDVDASGFWRFGAHLSLDEPIGPRQLFARLAFATVVGDEEEVPYYLLPRLGGRLLPGLARYRLRGNSMFVLSTGVEQPLFSVLGYGGVDLVLMAGAGNVYDDFTRQFTPRISFDKRLLPQDRVPLRPTISAGFRLWIGDRPLELTALAGISPERLSLVTFRLRRDIRHRQGLLFR